MVEFLTLKRAAKKNTRLVFINQDVGYLMIDILNKFTQAGYECVLITGRVVERKAILDKRVKKDKIIYYNRSTITKRLISWIVGFIQILFKVITNYRKDTLFIVTNPPLAPLLPLITFNRYYQLVFDLDLVRVLDTRLIKQSELLSKYWRFTLKRIMGKADKVFTLTKGMAKSLKPYVEDKNLLIMPLWTDNEELLPLKKCDNPFAKEYGLEDKFVVMYSGNLGASSGVEPLLEVARITGEIIQFIIVGEGLRKEALINKRDKYGLSNCLFLPWQLPETLPYSLAAADLAVICLAGSESNRSIPSKLYNNMSVGNPILAITNRYSDLAEVVNGFKIGKVFEAEEINDIANFISSLAADSVLQNEYRANSQKASLNFTSDNIDIILNNL